MLDESHTLAHKHIWSINKYYRSLSYFPSRGCESIKAHECMSFIAFNRGIYTIHHTQTWLQTYTFMHTSEICSYVTFFWSYVETQFITIEFYCLYFLIINIGWWYVDHHKYHTHFLPPHTQMWQGDITTPPNTLFYMSEITIYFFRVWTKFCYISNISTAHSFQHLKVWPSYSLIHSHAVVDVKSSSYIVNESGRWK